MVDQLARNLAHKIEAGEVSAPSNVTVDDAYKIAADISMKSWQRFWDNTGTGRQTYALIPVVGTKVTFPNSRYSGISYSRMLLHDTLLKYDGYRTGISDTPQCECGMAVETTEHIVASMTPKDKI